MIQIVHEGSAAWVSELTLLRFKANLLRLSLGNVLKCLCAIRKFFQVILTPYVNYAFCVINYACASLSCKTMANSPEYCIYTLVMNTYCINKRGFHFLPFFISFSTPLFLFFPLSFTNHSLQCPQVSFFLFFLVVGEI